MQRQSVRLGLETNLMPELIHGTARNLLAWIAY
jgi:hypothetical protein